MSTVDDAPGAVDPDRDREKELDYDKETDKHDRTDKISSKQQQQKLTSASTKGAAKKRCI